MATIRDAREDKQPLLSSIDDDEQQPDPTPALLHTHEPEVTIFEAAKRGSLQSLIYLVENHYATPNDVNEKGTTALHYAAAGNHVDCISYLLDRGAPIDPIGDEWKSTPLHWAVRSGSIAAMHRLLQAGADPTLKDGQGSNVLHMAAQCNDVFVILYLILYGLDLDPSDEVGGYTPLMWAANQGKALMVDLLLRFGADVHRRDHHLSTALHWATVKGNRLCIQHLVRHDADPSARDRLGKSPLDLVHELRLGSVWQRATKTRRVSERMVNLIAYILPFVLLPFLLKTLAWLPWYLGAPAAFVEFALANFTVMKLAGGLLNTPYLASIFQASAFWVWITWIWIVFYHRHVPVVHAIFLFSFMVAMYCFYSAVLADPGFIAYTSREIQRQTVFELAERKILDHQHFCTTCMEAVYVQTLQDMQPMCGSIRPVNHCPWMANCIGIRNHKSFMIFLVFLGLSIITFVTISVEYLMDKAPELKQCSLGSLCEYFAYDAWTTTLAAWIAIGTTTNESIKSRRRSRREPRSPAVAALVGADVGGLVTGTGDASSSTNQGGMGCLSIVAGARAIHRAHSLRDDPHREHDTMDQGCWTNCIDFWCTSRVDWYTLYDIHSYPQSNSPV
ncbi:Palmitoyltransferase zdhhc13 [Apophysomyces ossiformis]|uniref:Palmitoyltransferase n=1 Tax=Apophysomyces ossiformis TaxID=679940 RepID=A0A8H7BTC4_9FUNG|nr:Palmitoyltransferase zdhhc13 [Apophysomyces ossiformis]